MDILIVFLSSFAFWALLLGVPYFVAKKVNAKTPSLAKPMQTIIPPEAYLHNAFLYVAILFVSTSLLVLLNKPETEYAFKALIVFLMVGFTHQILRLFRK